MALETLKDVTEIDGFGVAQLESTRMMKPEEFVIVNHGANSVSFTIQNGPVKENGVNGCQVDTLIATAKLMIEGLNKDFPSDHNDLAVEYLGFALKELDRRKADRERRGVEGMNRA